MSETWLKVVIPVLLKVPFPGALKWQNRQKGSRKEAKSG